MDPTKLLESILDDAKFLTEDTGEERDAISDSEVGVELAELIQTLHEWLSRGGFLPEQWKGAR